MQMNIPKKKQLSLLKLTMAISSGLTHSRLEMAWAAKRPANELLTGLYWSANGPVLSLFITKPLTSR